MDSRNRWSRRRRLAILTVVGLALLGLTAAISVGCGSDSNGDDAADDSKPKVLVIGHWTAPGATLDPSTETGSSTFLGVAYETLTRYNPDVGDVEPMLATEWETPDEGVTWTFKLREGVKFHDGTDLDAEAVKFSIERTQATDEIGWFWWAVESIEVVDPLTVKFTCSFPQPLQLMLSSAFGAYIMSPTAVQENGEEWLKTNEAGTGAYMLKDYAEGQQVTLTQFPDYWQGWDGRHFEAAVIKVVPEEASRRQLIETGEAGIVTRLSPEDREALSSDENVEAILAESWDDMNVKYNGEAEYTSDVDVRKALSYSIPYDKIIEAAWGGAASRMYGPIPPSLWGSEQQDAVINAEPAIKYEYDLDKAADALAKAGHADGGFSLQAVVVSGDTAAETVCQLWKESLAELGIELKVKTIPRASYANVILEQKDWNMQPGLWWPAYASAYDSLYGQLGTQDPAFLNITFWSNPDFDALIDEGNAVSATDLEAAGDLFAEAIAIAWKDAPMMSIAAVKSAPAYNKTVVGDWSGFNPAYAQQVDIYNVVPAE